MRTALHSVIAFVMLAASTSALASAPVNMEEAPVGDFSFTTRNGVNTTLSADLSKLAPETVVRVLFFDPDCGECKGVIFLVSSDTELSEDIAKGEAAVIAIYPTAGVPEPDDPDMQRYLREAPNLPESWIVGTDNGSVFDTDACTWDVLPQLYIFKAGAPLRKPASEE